MKPRQDGRSANQMRPMAANFSALAGCDGSARLIVGDTEVLVGVQGPRPPKSLRLEDSTGALLEVTVSPPAGPSNAGVPLLGLVSAAEALWAARVEKAAFTSSANAGAASAMSEDDASAAASSRSSGAAASSSGGFASSSSGSSRAPVLLLDPAEDELEEASAAPEKWARLLHACLWRGDDASTLRLRCDGALSPDQLAAHSTATHAAAATVLAFLRLALTQRVERDAVCFVGDAAAIGVATTTGTFKRPAAVAVAGAGAGAASESGASAAAPAGATAAVDADDA